MTNILNSLLDLIKIDGDKLSSINKLLERITKYSNGDGAILWERNPNTDHLFIVAHWFSENQQISVHDLPFKSSVTGSAIRSMTPAYIEDVDKNVIVDKNTSFWQKNSYKSFFAIPIDFKDGNKGALNVYSTKTKPFDDNTRSELIILASILPYWYHSLRSRVTFNLIAKIDELTRQTQISDITNYLDLKNEITLLFQNICNEVSSNFQCFETSIFLNDPFKSIDEYELLASTWNPRTNKRVYKKKEEEGLTGWILYNNRNIKITDLLLFDEQKDIIQKEYPNITWQAESAIKEAVAERLGINDTQQLPPLGFMGAPIISGEDVYGVIRCCAALDIPYFFGSCELEILDLIATRIGHTWRNFIQQNVINEDAVGWREMVSETSKLDLFVLDELESPDPNLNNIFNKALSVLPKLIRDAEITDVRLVNSDTQELFFVATSGEAWNQGSTEEIRLRKDKKFPLVGENLNSAGAKVFHEGNTYILEHIRKGIDAYDETFEQAKKLIVVPLSIGKKVLGVLDIRSVKDRPFQATAQSIAELMGRQLALYSHLVQTIIAHKKLQDEQLQAYQDFVHQVRSPIYQASARSRKAVNAVINSASITPSLVHNLLATSGLCNKATRVAKNISIFSDLAKGISIKLNVSQIDYDTLIKLLKETASDNSIMISPQRNIKIDIDRKSFLFLKDTELSLDTDLVEQAINVILDNAVKYSYDNTIISISAELTRNKSSFQIIVRNQGIPLEKDEVLLCKKRGWRSELASSSTGEGLGIGLWIVDNIMKAHKGSSLEIKATDDDGYTNVKLIFKVNQHIL